MLLSIQSERGTILHRSGAKIDCSPFHRLILSIQWVLLAAGRARLIADSIACASGAAGRTFRGDASSLRCHLARQA
jgi:hypothetical protein